MSFLNQHPIARLGLCTLYFLVAALVAMPLVANAAIIYVDANSGSGGNTVRDSNNSTTDWVGASNLADDNFWFNRTSGAGQFGEGDVWETLVPNENAPLLRTTVTGLTNGPYDVYVYFGTASDSGTLWQIQAGLANTGLTQYSSASTGAEKLFDDTTFDGWRVKIGTANVTGGSLSVFIDNMTGPSGSRTYYDGIGYELVPEPSSLAMLAFGMISLWMFRRKK